MESPMLNLSILRLVAGGALATAYEWQAPLSGIGPITADPAHPFYNNPVAADLGVSSTYRVADLDNEAAKDLKPWAIEALQKQNALALAGRNGETRQGRCWDVGVPDIHEAYANGDTLVVDTIPLNDRILPTALARHTPQSFTSSNDSKSRMTARHWTLRSPWMIRTRSISHGARAGRVTGRDLSDEPCALNNDDKFNLGFDPVPTADHPDF
jgi:hypothetical protein